MWGSYGIDSADLDLDGNIDLVVASDVEKQILIRYGNGSGSFATVRTEQIGEISGSVVIADIKGDNRPDIAALKEPGAAHINNLGGANVSVLLGNGVHTMLVFVYGT